MRARAAAALALAALAAGCASIDWTKTGEAWRDSLCRDQYRDRTCPDDPDARLPDREPR